MSNLVYQNYNNKCQGWVNPSSLFFGPQINSLTSFQSPAGSTSLVTIIGENFFSYSIVKFGTYSPTTFFINSNQLSFYVPTTLNSGSFPIQVFNGAVASNIVMYTIDNSSGYWLLLSNGNITNTNQTAIVNVQSLSRNAPLIVTSDFNLSNMSSVNWIICDTTTGNISLTFPSGPDYTGREIMIKNVANNSVLSSSTNISPDGTTLSTNILSGIGKWATLVYDGSKWIIMQSN